MSGIHQVPIAQKKSVNPFKNGSIAVRKSTFWAFKISVDPASVDMATAPMLIQ